MQRGLADPVRDTNRREIIVQRDARNRRTPELSSLTEAGMLWAVANVTDSLVARVAIAGESSGWPAEFVETAEKTCNEQARLSLHPVA